jgi:hypothetical protein
MADQDWKSTFLSKLPEVFHIILAMTGVAIVILAAAMGIKYKDWSLNITDPTSRTSLAAFGVLVMVLGLYLRRAGSTTEASLPKAKDYDITITYPTTGTKLSAKTTVLGGIKKALPTGFSLWVFRTYDDGRFSPLRKCEITGDKWEAPNCDPGEKPGERRFSVNIVGTDGSALISYVKEASDAFWPIRQELIRAGNKNAPYLPSVLQRTRDIVECHSVKYERT